MYDTILVPTDGSDVATAAGEFACELAVRFDASIHVVSVETNGDDSAVDPIVETATKRDVRVTSAILEREESIHAEIVGYADEQDVDLIAMGTHGEGGLDRFRIGSVAEQTLQESPVPVATVHDETRIAPDLERVLVATDGSSNARAAVDHAISLARAADATLQAVHVTEEKPLEADEGTYDVVETSEIGTPAIDDVLERARAAGLDELEIYTPEGRVDQAILAVAAERSADCIVVGSHGKTGMRRYLLGSNTERLARFSTVPVFAVDPPAGVTATVEFLDYTVLEERGWSVDDPDLFEKAESASLDPDAYGTFEVDGNEYVLDAAESAGHEWPFYCRAGGCVDCAAKLLEGDLEMDVNRRLTDAEVAEENLRLTCVATPTTETVKLVTNVKEMESLQDRVM